MKPFVKVIIAGAAIACAGLIVLLVALGVNGWQLSETVDWAQDTYECTAQVSEIAIKFNAGQLETVFYDGNSIKVDYSYSNRFTTKFNVKGAKLSIETSSIRWFGVNLWIRSIPKTTVYIPNDWVVDIDAVVNAGTVKLADGTYGDVKIKMNAGTVNLEDIVANKVNLEVNAGALNVTSAVCNTFSCDVSAGGVKVSKLTCDKIGIDVSAGSVNIKVDGAKSQYTVSTDVSAGNCNLSNQSGTDPNKKITVDVSAGSVTISFNA